MRSPGPRSPRGRVALGASPEEAASISDPSEALRRDVTYLGRVLGDTLVEQESPELLAVVEDVRALAKARRGRIHTGIGVSEIHIRGKFGDDAPSAVGVMRL